MMDAQAEYTAWAANMAALQARLPDPLPVAVARAATAEWATSNDDPDRIQTRRVAFVRSDLTVEWTRPETAVLRHASRGTVLHVVGTTASVINPPAPINLYGIWGVSASDFWVAGERGVIVNYDGTAYAVVESGTTLALRSVWGAGASDIWAVCDNGTLTHYNGTAWLLASADRGGESLNAVWGPSTMNGQIYTVGDRGL